MNALALENVRKIYPNGTEALTGVTLAVAKGQFFALLGPNGAGKTTMLSIVSGLGHKTSGEVLVESTSIDEDPDTAKTFIGLVPQEFNCNIFERVIDIVLDQAGYYGIPRSEAEPRALALLQDLGLFEKRFDKAQSLSGGMKRRLLIARALIHDPDILLLDEPTAGVDVELRRQMWDYLRTVNANGKTIILTTHYLEEAEELCSEVAIIHKGAILLKESMTDLLSRHDNRKLEDIYLELIAEK